MSKSKDKKPTPTKPSRNQGRFHIEFKNQSQKDAWAKFQTHDILFLNGPAGVGKSFLAVAFAINEVLTGNKKRIILTRPVVESGESLGFLPGTLEEKINPYMMPLYDCLKVMCGDNNPQRDMINAAVEVAPLAYLRGRTFSDAICILDEAQNTSMMQMKLFMTRLGENSKMLITGDPSQSDLGGNYVALVDVINRLKDVEGVGIIDFGIDCIVRHPLVGKVIERLG